MIVGFPFLGGQFELGATDNVVEDFFGLLFVFTPQSVQVEHCLEITTEPIHDGYIVNAGFGFSFKESKDPLSAVLTIPHTGEHDLLGLTVVVYKAVRNLEDMLPLEPGELSILPLVVIDVDGEEYLSVRHSHLESLIGGAIQGRLTSVMVALSDFTGYLVGRGGPNTLQHEVEHGPEFQRGRECSGSPPLHDT